MSELLLVGNTYPVRAKLKELGCRWDAASRGWRVPKGLEDVAKDILASAGPSKGIGQFDDFTSAEAESGEYEDHLVGDDWNW